jgi:hypothetical protein
MGNVVTGGPDNTKYGITPYWNDTNFLGDVGFYNKAYVLYVFYEA